MKLQICVVSSCHLNQQGPPIVRSTSGGVLRHELLPLCLGGSVLAVPHTVISDISRGLERFSRNRNENTAFLFKQSLRRPVCKLNTRPIISIYRRHDVPVGTSLNNLHASHSWTFICWAFTVSVQYSCIVRLCFDGHFCHPQILF